MNENQNQYKVVFAGQLMPDMTLEQVKSKLKSQLKLPDKSIARLFNPEGKPIVVKRLDSAEKAELMSAKFAKLGMVLDIEVPEFALEIEDYDTTEDKSEPQKQPQEVEHVKEQPSMASAVPHSAASHNTNIGSGRDTVEIHNEKVVVQDSQQQEHDVNDGTEEAQVSRIQEVWWSVIYYKWPIIFTLVGLVFVLAYSPVPEGFLKKGFIIGLVFLVLGYRSFKARY